MRHAPCRGRTCDLSKKNTRVPRETARLPALLIALEEELDVSTFEVREATGTLTDFIKKIK
jgi:hypothetical protein